MIHTNRPQETGVSTYALQNHSNQPEPSEPGPIRRTEEMIGYLQSLEMTLYQISDRLFGPQPACDNAGNKEARTAIPLDELLAKACTMSAQLCGFASTLQGKL